MDTGNGSIQGTTLIRVLSKGMNTEFNATMGKKERQEERLEEKERR